MRKITLALMFLLTVSVVSADTWTASYWSAIELTPNTGSEAILAGTKVVMNVSATPIDPTSAVTQWAWNYELDGGYMNTKSVNSFALTFNNGLSSDEVNYIISNTVVYDILTLQPINWTATDASATNALGDFIAKIDWKSNDASDDLSSSSVIEVAFTSHFGPYAFAEGTLLGSRSNYYSYGNDTIPVPAEVPEPTAIVFGFMGLSGIGLIKRFRRV